MYVCMYVCKNVREKRQVFSESEKKAGRQRQRLAGKVRKHVGKKSRARKRRQGKHTADHQRIVKVTNGTN